MMAQWRQIARVQLSACVLSIGIDVALWLGLREDPAIARAVLGRFVAVNITLLAFLGASFAAQARWRRLQRPWIAAVLAALMCGTAVIWIQTTGSVTSYFALAGTFMVVAYRLWLGWSVAAVAALTLVILHTGIIVLERMGLLTPEPLFVGAARPLYTASAYPLSVVVSIGLSYVGALVGANIVVQRLRAKDRALEEARRLAAIMAADAGHGVHSGTVLSCEYALGEVIGRGGMGEVYLGTRVSDDRPVAIKVLHRHLSDQPSLVERFAREAWLLDKVPARCTAGVLEVGHDVERGVRFLAMEYLRGEDLSAYLRRGDPLPLDEVVALVQAIAAVVDAAHAAGVVHRDLKPSNVQLLAAEPGSARSWSGVRLLDFGIGKIAGASESTLTSAGAVLGTLGFIAPEQLAGQHERVGPAADRYALAALAYRALTGRCPYDAPDAASALRAILLGQHRPPSAIRPELVRDLDAVLLLGLARDPENRHASCAAFARDLAAAARAALAPLVRERAAALARTLGPTPEEPAAAVSPEGPTLRGVVDGEPG